MTDRTTKALLLIIGLGLLANAAALLVHPTQRALAAQSFTCKGGLKANVWGGTTANIGGYEVEVKCD